MDHENANHPTEAMWFDWVVGLGVLNLEYQHRTSGQGWTWNSSLANSLPRGYSILSLQETYYKVVPAINMSSTSVLSTKSGAILVPLGVKSLEQRLLQSTPMQLYRVGWMNRCGLNSSMSWRFAHALQSLRFVGFTEQATSAILHRWRFFSVTHPD